MRAPRRMRADTLHIFNPLSFFTGSLPFFPSCPSSLAAQHLAVKVAALYLIGIHETQPPNSCTQASQFEYANGVFVGTFMRVHLYNIRHAQGQYLQQQDTALRASRDHRIQLSARKTWPVARVHRLRSAPGPPMPSALFQVQGMRIAPAVQK